MATMPGALPTLPVDAVLATDDDMDMLLALLARSTWQHLRLAVLAVMPEGQQAADPLCEAMQRSPELAVQGVRIHIAESDVRLLTVLQALQRGSGLPELTVQYDSEGSPEVAAALSEVIRHNSALRALHLVLLKRVAAVVCIGLAEALAHNAGLVDFSLDISLPSHDTKSWPCHEADAIGVAFASAIARHSSLARCSLKGKCWKVGSQTGLSLAQCLSESETLKHLHVDLQHLVGLGEETVEAMAAALKTNRLLQSLTLVQMSSPDSLEGDFEDRASYALAEVLRCNTTLQSLRVGWLTIDHKACHALFEALSENTSLRSLKLEGTIRNESSRALATALRKNATLRSLKLGGIIMNGNATCEDLTLALRQNATLQCLQVSDFDLDDQRWDQTSEALESFFHTAHLVAKRNTTLQRTCATMRELARAEDGHLDSLKTLVFRNKVLEYFWPKDCAFRGISCPMASSCGVEVVKRRRKS